MTSTDLVEIMTFNSISRSSQEWTDDRERLITALKKLTIGRGRRPGGPGRHHRR